MAGEAKYNKKNNNPWLAQDDSCAKEQALTNALVLGNTDAGLGAGHLIAGGHGGEVVMVAGSAGLETAEAATVITMQVEYFDIKKDATTGEFVVDTTEAREVHTVVSTVAADETAYAEGDVILRHTPPVNAVTAVKVSIGAVGATAVPVGSVEVAFIERALNQL